MKIAYLTNQHPYSSCTFIRREIVALEEMGVPIRRYSIRTPEMDIIDDADKEEIDKTQYILKIGVIALLLNLLRVIITKPGQFITALKLTWKLGSVSDRGVIINLAYLVEACVLQGWCAQAQITHIHSHFGSNSTAVAMLCHILGGPPYSFTVHGPEEFDKPIGFSLKEKIHRSKFVAAVSSFSKSQLFRWCDYKQWSKIHIIHCGVNQLFLEQPYVPLPSEPRFVSVGRLSEQKGHLLLVEAASQLAAAGYRFKVILVGDGNLRPEIERLIKDLRLEDYIEITGWATNLQVQQQILAAQIMVLPSFAEGLPVVIMEALALSRPIIATHIAGIPELVQPGLDGWLVPAGSVEALVEAMKSAINTPPEQLAEMGKAGSHLVAKEHNIMSEAKKLLELFQKYA